MSNTILLLNFDEKAAQKLQRELEIPCEIGRLVIGTSNGEEVSYSYSMPKSLYDYTIVFADLSNCTQQIKRKALFYTGEEISAPTPEPTTSKSGFFGNLFSPTEEKIAELEIEITPTVEPEEEIKYHSYTPEELSNFWRRKGFLVIFSSKEIRSLGGITGIKSELLSLVPARENDSSLDVFLNSRSESKLAALFSKVCPKQIQFPLENYVESPFAWGEHHSPPFARPIYKNKNGDSVGIVLDVEHDYHSFCPRLLVLPQFKKTENLLADIVKGIADEYPKMFPTLIDENWVKNYLPEKVQNFDEQITQTVAEAKKEIEEIKIKQQEEREKYDFLLDLLTQKGGELKDCVHRVFSEILEISVTDADEENKLPREDLVLEYEDNSYLVEVKGDIKSNPKAGHVSQTFKHGFKARGDGLKFSAAVLILNYDYNTDPQNRAVAYNSESEERELEEIIFIDSRVLFFIARDVVDEKISKEDALKTLFEKNGRIEYSPKLDGLD